jgi:hypothetical protein
MRLQDLYYSGRKVRTAMVAAEVGGEKEQRIGMISGEECEMYGWVRNVKRWFEKSSVGLPSG